MKRNLLALFLVGTALIGIARDTKSNATKICREGTEWTDVWIPWANGGKRPRCIIIGDSVVRGYYDLVCRRMGDSVNCAKFATSASVADPAFRLLLEGVLLGYDYNVIHLNNGLHGWDYTEEEYKAGYEAVIKMILAKAPKAKLVLALTTPLKPTDREKTKTRNQRISARNKIVRQLAAKYGAAVNDLHKISVGHPEYYRDGVHYKTGARTLQAEQVAQSIASQLRAGDATK